MIIDFNSGDSYTKSQIDAMIANCVTVTTDDLVNYYLKSDTYSKSEVNTLIGNIDQFHYEIYASTAAITDPAGNVLYLIGPSATASGDLYEEYVYSNNTFVKIGDTSIDLSDYVTDTDLQTALNAYVTSTGLATILADYTPTANLASVATSGSYVDLSNKPTIPDDLNDLTDVNITSPTNGQVMKYNATTSKWENATGGGGGGGSTVELTQAQYDALATKDPDTTYIITDADAIDMDDYALATTVTTGLASKADKQTVTANTNTMKFPYWNADGVVTGQYNTQVYSKAIQMNGNSYSIFRDLNYNIDPFYAPTSAGTSGQIVKSNGSGAPTWVNLETLTGGLKFWMGTQAQYTALSPNYDSSTLYVITD